MDNELCRHVNHPSNADHRIYCTECDRDVSDTHDLDILAEADEDHAVPTFYVVCRGCVEWSRRQAEYEAMVRICEIVNQHTQMVLNQSRKLHGLEGK
jgi:putative AlgH/UPF0301 family transcriptional regulator